MLKRQHLLLYCFANVYHTTVVSGFDKVDKLVVLILKGVDVRAAGAVISADTNYDV